MDAQISQTERDAISELRRRIGSDLLDKHSMFNTDFDLLRWLQGFNFHIDTVVPKLRNHLLLRSAWNIDTIAEWYQHPSEVTQKYIHFGPLKTPEQIEDCATVSIECIGRDDTDGLGKSISYTQLYKFQLWLGETHYIRYIHERESKTGRQSWMIVVFDLEGVPSIETKKFSLSIKQLRAYCKFFESQYVELLKKAVLINAPSYIYYVWKYIVAPFMPARTKKKLVILGSDWRQHILEHIDPQALPVYWGGTRVDKNGDEMCRSKIIIPGSIPPELYWSKHNDPRYSKETFSNFFIQAGREVRIIIGANENDRIEHVIFCESAYTFFVEFSPNHILNEPTECHLKHESEKPNDFQTVLPSLDFLGNSYVPEEDILICSQRGAYAFCFGNSAWFGSVSLLLKLMRNGEQVEISFS